MAEGAGQETDALAQNMKTLLHHMRLTILFAILTGLVTVGIALLECFPRLSHGVLVSLGLERVRGGEMLLCAQLLAINLALFIPAMIQSIKRLREKVEGVSEQWALKTVWGVGYKFELIGKGK